LYPLSLPFLSMNCHSLIVSLSLYVTPPLPPFVPPPDSQMMLCDHCDAAYHIYCLNPPLPAVPEGTIRLPLYRGRDRLVSYHPLLYCIPLTLSAIASLILASVVSILLYPADSHSSALPSLCTGNWNCPRCTTWLSRTGAKGTVPPLYLSFNPPVNVYPCYE
jgi:hypothetical protein